MFRLLDQAAFEVANVRLREILVLADEEDDMVPKVLFEMTFDPISN